MNPLIIRVKFDKSFFGRLVSTSLKFWFQYVLPEILSKKLCHVDNQSAEQLESGGEGKSNLHMKDHMYAVQSDNAMTDSHKCPFCHSLCKEEKDVKTFGERSIGLICVIHGFILPVLR